MAKTSQGHDGTDLCILPPRGWSGDLYFTTSNNRHIRYGHAPAHGTARGTIVLTHGYSEHAELFFEVIGEYQKIGFDVWTMDWHGQGFSGRAPTRDSLPSNDDRMSDHAADLHEFATGIVRRHPGKPLILSANSMGGHVGMLHLQNHPDVFDAAIMAAPMLDINRLNLPLYLRGIVRSIFHVACALGLGRIPVPTYTGLADRFNLASFGIDAYKNDTPRQRRNHALRDHFHAAQIDMPSFGWIRNSFESADQIMKPENLSKIKIPVLLGSGGKDGLVDNEAHGRAVKSMANAIHVQFNDASHNLWFERDIPYRSWLSRVRDFTDAIAPPDHGYGQFRGTEPYKLAA